MKVSFSLDPAEAIGVKRGVQFFHWCLAGAGSTLPRKFSVVKSSFFSGPLIRGHKELLLGASCLCPWAVQDSKPLQHPVEMYRKEGNPGNSLPC